MNLDPSPSPLDELLADPQLDRLRALTLSQGLDLLRRRRQRRTALGIAGSALGVILLVVVASSTRFRREPDAGQTLLIGQTRPAPTTAVNIAMSSSPDSELPALHQLTDDELLALFPGRPVALIGPAGNQRLVFLDESR